MERSAIRGSCYKLERPRITLRSIRATRSYDPPKSRGLNGRSKIFHSPYKLAGSIL